MRSPTILIAGGYDKQTPLEEMANSIAASYVYKVILTGDTSEKIAEALIGARFNNYSIAITLKML